MDAIRVRLFPQSTHGREDRIVAYRAMHLVAEILSRQGLPVIVNAGYSHRSDRLDLEDTASRGGARCASFWKVA